MEKSERETEQRSAQLQDTMLKLNTVRDTLKDATEINNYKAKELKDKVCHTLNKYFGEVSLSSIIFFVFF